jgi:Zn-dependent protease
MSQNDPWAPGQTPPPPPPYEVTSDIPPDSPHHYSPAPSQSANRGLLSYLGAILTGFFAIFKYGGLLLLKFKFLGTLLSLVVSFGGYALFYGPWFAAALVANFLVHELGHVVEIRRQGGEVSAVLLIPFFGAATFNKSLPADAVRQAEISIAGPIAGTIGATAAFALYGATHSPILLLFALIGFYLNLLNLIPIWQLDGSRILAPVSKWFLVAGFAMLAVGGLFLHWLLSPFIIIIALLGIPNVIQRFRDADNPWYTSVPTGARWAMGFAWLTLVIYLGVASVQVSSLLSTFPR